MNTANRSDFRTCALGSGLVTQDQLEQALGSLRARGVPHDRNGQVDDRRLADCLVQLGIINDWQADQLLAGMSKFTLGPYQITDSIGEGGMGQVFKGTHFMMGRTVAIKVLPREKSTPDAVASFAHEVRSQAMLDHDNLVRAFDAGHDGKRYYLVTEYVPGTDLRRYVRTHGPLTMQQAAIIISQAALGLAHAHERGLIHRDVKPGNLLVTAEGHTKVSDLGLAGSLQHTDEDPRAGRTVGTADYLSPEQILSPSEITPASDVYSLGCTLYYAVTGKVPYPGGNSRQKARRHCEDTPLYPMLFNPDLSDDFIEVIADMMAKNPDDRVQTMGEVARRLAPWVGESIEAPADAKSIIAKSVAGRFSFNAPLSRPIVPGLGDTQPVFPDFGPFETEPHESPSQLSQGTEPVDAAAQETLPIDTDQRLFSPSRWTTRARWVAAATSIAAAVAAAALFFAL